MKNIIGIALAWVLFSTVSIAQSTASTNETKTNCIPTKECAAKAGITLEECKKICSSKTSSEASSTSVASASLVSNTETKKNCCASMKECAAKMGMTEAECKAKCNGKSKTAMVDEIGDSKVASAVKVNEIEEIPTSNSAAKKSCSKTCSKKKG